MFLSLSSPGAPFFCCRCGGAFFFAVVAGARFFFLLSSRGCVFFFAVVPGARFLFCCRPWGRVFAFAVVPGGAFFFAVVAGARFFLAVVPLFFAVVAGTGAHSLTGFLGPRNDNKNQHKATTAKKNTGSVRNLLPQKNNHADHDTCQLLLPCWRCECAQHVES